MNSIKREITAATIAAEIRMLRASFVGSFLLLEGATDLLLFKTLIDRKKCSLHDCQGKENVLTILNELNKSKFAGVLRIVDADFGHVLGGVATLGNLCVTDLNDIESMLLNSSAWQKVLSVHGSEAKIRKIESDRGRAALEIIIDEALKIGRMRLAAKRMHWPIDFDGMKFQFADASGIEIEPHRTVQHLLARSKITPPISPDEVFAAIDLDKGAACHGLYLCSGHDVCRLASRALRALLGSVSAFENDPGALLRALILAADSKSFSNTTLARQIRSWEQSNPPYMVLSVH